MGPPSKKPNPVLRQLHLDFGQRTIGAQRCARCGMVFETVHEDLSVHMRVCKALADRNAAAAAQSQQASSATLRRAVETLAAGGRAQRVFASPEYDTFAVDPHGATALRESIDAFVGGQQPSGAPESATIGAVPLRQCHADDTLVVLFKADAVVAAASARRLTAPVRVAACIRDAAAGGGARDDALRSQPPLVSSPPDSPIVMRPRGAVSFDEPAANVTGASSPTVSPPLSPALSPAPHGRSASPGPRIDGEVTVTYLNVVGVIDAWLELPLATVTPPPPPREPEPAKPKQMSLAAWFGAAAASTGLDAIASSLTGAGTASRRRPRDADAVQPTGAGSIPAALYRAMALGLALDPATPVRCFAFGRTLVDSGTAARVARSIAMEAQPNAGATQVLRIAVQDSAGEGGALGASEFYTEWVS